MGLKCIITDDFIDVLTDILVTLETGGDVQSTCIYHEEFKSRMITYGWVDEKDLKIRVEEELLEQKEMEKESKREIRITAKEAREKSTTVLGDKVKKELDEIDNLIGVAIKTNKLGISIYKGIDSLTKKNLELRGFKIEIHDDQRDGITVNINW